MFEKFGYICLVIMCLGLTILFFYCSFMDIDKFSYIKTTAILERYDSNVSSEKDDVKYHMGYYIYRIKDEYYTAKIETSESSLKVGHERTVYYNPNNHSDYIVGDPKMMCVLFLISGIASLAGTIYFALPFIIKKE